MSVDLEALVLPAFTDLPGLPGERRPWIEAYDLDRTVDVEGVPDPVYTDGSLGVVPTGVGKSAAASTTTALLAGDELDLSDALVLSVAVAGGPPTDVTVGSVVLADAVVDWDTKLRWHEDGESEVATNPYNADAAIFELDADRVQWARQQADEVALSWEGVELAREVGFEDAPDPAVVVGTSLCGDELWHGAGIATRAQELIAEYGGGTYCATQMEDLGTALALDRFDRLDQYVSVRGISNFDRPAPERSVRDSLFGQDFEAGFPVAIENAVQVGRALVEEWIDGSES